LQNLKKQGEKNKSRAKKPRPVETQLHSFFFGCLCEATKNVRSNKKINVSIDKKNSRKKKKKWCEWSLTAARGPARAVPCLSGLPCCRQ
jgi:hypothetical protein